MSSLLLLFGFFLADFLLSVSGFPTYLCLLFPAHLFIRSHSPKIVLIGGGIAAFLSEILHQLAVGTLMTGVGVSLLFFHWLVGVINWNHRLPRALSLLLYFVIILVTRVVLVRLAFGYWFLPRLLPFVVTYVLGVAMIVYQLGQFGQRNRGPLGINAR